MNYETFLQKCCDISPSLKKSCYSYYRNAEKLLGGNIDSSNRLSDKRCINKLFNPTGFQLGRSQFYKNKQLTKRLYSALFDLNLIDSSVLEYVNKLSHKDVISNEELFACYFKNLYDVIQYITELGKYFGFCSQEDMLMYKSIAVLAWNGYNATEIVEFTKQEALESMFAGSEILRLYSMCDVNEGFPSHKLQLYKESLYLFRTMRQDRINKNNLQCSLAKFNAISYAFGKRISIPSLRRNGIFYEIDQCESEVNLQVFIDKIGGDQSFATSVRALFYKWREIYGGVKYAAGDCGNSNNMDMFRP